MRGNFIIVRAPIAGPNDRAGAWLARRLADDLLALQMLHPKIGADPFHAYQISKRGNSLRAKAEAVRWGGLGARVGMISPGIVITPVAKDELTWPRGGEYRRMIELHPTGRAAKLEQLWCY